MKNRFLRRTVLTLITMSVTLLALSSAHAQQEYIAQVETKLRYKTAALFQSGYRGIFGNADGLNNQTHRDYRLNLNGGAEYMIAAVCDEDCYDLDVALYDRNGNLIGYDETEDAEPMVAVQVYTGGSFTLRVTMYHCEAEPCYYAVGLYGL